MKLEYFLSFLVNPIISAAPSFPRLSKTFIDKISGRRWAREIELQMDKNIFEDYSGAAGTTLKSLLIKYRDEITSKKRVNYTINKHTIDRFKVVADKDMRKMSNIVENLIRRYVESRV